MKKHTMPFGKHKGEALDKIPESYLSWCLQNIPKLSPNLKKAMEEELLNREAREQELQEEENSIVAEGDLFDRGWAEQ